MSVKMWPVVFLVLLIVGCGGDESESFVDQDGVESGSDGSSEEESGEEEGGDESVAEEGGETPEEEGGETPEEEGGEAGESVEDPLPVRPRVEVKASLEIVFVMQLAWKTTIVAMTLQSFVLT